MNCEHLFVYGMLRRGVASPVATAMARWARHIGPACCKGRLYRVSYYPGAVPSADTADVIHGDLYALLEPERLLAQLDEYEDCAPASPQPHLYRREKTVITPAAGATFPAWIYWYNRPVDGLERIPSGDWLASRLAAE